MSLLMFVSSFLWNASLIARLLRRRINHKARKWKRCVAATDSTRKSIEQLAATDWSHQLAAHSSQLTVHQSKQYMLLYQATGYPILRPLPTLSSIQLLTALSLQYCNERSFQCCTTVTLQTAEGKWWTVICKSSPVAEVWYQHLNVVWGEVCCEEENSTDFCWWPTFDYSSNSKCSD